LPNQNALFLQLFKNYRTMDLNQLTAISPVDGRYRKQTSLLAPYFSEFGLIKYRVLVEIEYFIALAALPLPQLSQVSKDQWETLRNIYHNFTLADAEEIKDIEKTTNHDVKAVEYFLKKRFDQLNLSKQKEFIHFGLTSQDINNTAIPLSMLDFHQEQYLPAKARLMEILIALANQWQEIPMLARTHGQPASPTRLGKEIMVFCARLQQQFVLLDKVPFAAKFGGATGNFNAHFAAFPQTDWHVFADKFVKEQLKLNRSRPTTQIEHYDHLAALCDNYKRVNTILIDFARDVWQYVAMNYFKQKIKKDEVGSSAMPHKVNPIDFENAEGNLGMANAMLEHLSAKLPISRLQRDLTDSTVLRNVGVPLGHMLIAIQSLEKGLGKLELNEAAINHDLENNWVVVAEGIQTILRREGYPQPYEALKSLSRTNTKIGEKEIKGFIHSLEVAEEVKEELLKLTPQQYTGR